MCVKTIYVCRDILIQDLLHHRFSAFLFRSLLYIHSFPNNSLYLSVKYPVNYLTSTQTWWLPLWCVRLWNWYLMSCSSNILHIMEICGSVLVEIWKIPMRIQRSWALMLQMLHDSYFSLSLWIIIRHTRVSFSSVSR